MAPKRSQTHLLMSMWSSGSMVFNGSYMSDSKYRLRPGNGIANLRVDLRAIHQASSYDLKMLRASDWVCICTWSVKPRAHFSYCAMPHQADDNPGNSWEISRGLVETLHCRWLGAEWVAGDGARPCSRPTRSHTADWVLSEPPTFPWPDWCSFRPNQCFTFLNYWPGSCPFKNPTLSLPR